MNKKTHLPEQSTDKSITSGNIQEQTTENNPAYFDNKIQQIEGVPFVSVHMAECEYGIAFGNNLITERRFESHKAAARWVKQTDWLTILNVVGIMVDHEISYRNNLNVIK